VFVTLTRPLSQALEEFVRDIGVIQNNLAFHVSCVEEVALAEQPTTAADYTHYPGGISSGSCKFEARFFLQAA
jgi:hypothetical protein